MTKNDSNNTTLIILAILTIIGVWGAIYLLDHYNTSIQTGNLSVHCLLDEITYRDVTPDKCYGGFSPRHCPMPTTIDCNLSVNGNEIPALLSAVVNSK